VTSFFERAARRTVTTALLLITLTACTSVMSTVRSAVPGTGLRGQIDALTSQPEFRNAHWGVLVVNPRTGDTLYSKNAGKLFMPASNMKIITSAVALAQLGPDYSYRTTFAANGEVRDSLLDGDLIVIGRGDPTVSDRMRGLATLVMDTLADSLRAHGVRQVTGELAHSGNAFPDSTRGFGWAWNDLDEYYGAGVDELTFNEGTAPTTLGPLPDTLRDSLYSGPAKDPSKAWLEAYHDALTRKGIVVDGGVADSIAPFPFKLDTLFVYVSPPLRTILPVLMKPSQNQVAELVFKTIGLERGGLGSADSAEAVIRRQLLAWGAEPDGFAIYDGSGLSRRNMLTPETIVRVLDRMQSDTAFAVFYNSMPVAGVDGTLKTRMKGTPAEGNVHAKTGTIGSVTSLSGYVTSADGERLIFSILSNNWTTTTQAVRDVADQIAAALAALRTN